MKICLVHNAYGRVSGEEIVVQNLQRLLEAHCHRVVTFFRSSQEINEMTFGKARAFFSGIYNPAAARAFRRLLAIDAPDIVHIHNVFPLISPAVLGECRAAGIPVVMTVHNYRLVCPNGLQMRDGHACQECCGGREYRCVVHRCEGSVCKSLGYALRNAVARKLRFFDDNVTLYAALSEFQRGRLIDAGFNADRIVVIPNMVDGTPPPLPHHDGSYVGYVGRISPEKDVPTLLAAARQTPAIPFRAAGSYAGLPELPCRAPANFQFLGHVPHEKLGAFYDDARLMVLTSNCFEGFPTVLAEAMLHGKPVVCSRIGGLPEIVDDGRTGLLFKPGSAAELARKIRYFWDHPSACRRMGECGRTKSLREYSPDTYYRHLMNLYDKALCLGPGGPPRTVTRLA